MNAPASSVLRWFCVALVTASASFSALGDVSKTGIPDLESLAPPESGRYYRALYGFEPERHAGTILKLYAGTAAYMSGKELVSSGKQIFINMETVGLNGLDSGIFTDGVSYAIWLVRNRKTNEIGAVVSDAISVTKVVRPLGFEIVRKLPWGFVPMKGQIPAFHLSYWPKPFTRLTAAESSSEWRALDRGASRTFAEVDLSRWIPDNARLAYILCEVGNNGNGSGSASIRVSGEQKGGLVVGHSTAVGQISSVAVHQRITSARRLYYSVTGGAVLTIYVLGYSNSEPS